MRGRVLRVPRAMLAAAVLPEKLRDVLARLRDGGALAGFEERGAYVLLWGDLLALESFVESARWSHPDEQPIEMDVGTAVGLETPLNGGAWAPIWRQGAAAHDNRQAYYEAARRHLHTASFGRLTPLQRAIWRLHTDGVSFRKIARKLGISQMKVRWAIQGIRLAAKLPRVTWTTGRATTHSADK